MTVDIHILDEAFDIVANPPMSAVIVRTPLGEEVVPMPELRRQTGSYNLVELAALLADSSPHTHPTVRSFHAVPAPKQP